MQYSKTYKPHGVDSRTRCRRFLLFVRAHKCFVSLLLIPMLLLGVYFAFIDYETHEMESSYSSTIARVKQQRDSLFGQLQLIQGQVRQVLGGLPPNVTDAAALAVAQESGEAGDEESAEVSGRVGAVMSMLRTLGKRVHDSTIGEQAGAERSFGGGAVIRGMKSKLEVQLKRAAEEKARLRDEMERLRKEREMAQRSADDMANTIVELRDKLKATEAQVAAAKVDAAPIRVTTEPSNRQVHPDPGPPEPRDDVPARTGYDHTPPDREPPQHTNHPTPQRKPDPVPEPEPEPEPHRVAEPNSEPNGVGLGAPGTGPPFYPTRALAQKRPRAKAADLVNPTDPLLRREAVRAEMQWAWDGYKKFAWGRDELHPKSRSGGGGFKMGLTIVDALDTLMIMGMASEVEACRSWIARELHFGSQDDINLFETTIRILGGLLSAFALSGDDLFRQKATELADKMIFAFDSPTGLPYGTLKLPQRRAYNPSWVGKASSISEVATLQLEWQYLSRVTNNPVYGEKVVKVMEKLDELNMPHGLYPMWINPDTGRTTSSTITFGARADSLYEYLMKQWVISDGRDTRAKRMYENSMDGMRSQLLQKSSPSGYTYIAEKEGSTLRGKMDHLVCFVPGMLALGVYPKMLSGKNTGNPRFEQDMKLADELMETCVQFYKQTKTGLAPEIIQFDSNPNRDFFVDPHARHNLLRPETVESLFVMWRTTHDEKYREYAWDIFKAFRKYGRVPSGGYASLNDVDNNSLEDGDTQWGNWRDKMESFFLGETLKYLYLIFSDDDFIATDQWVFNTEAHPLPVFRD